MSAMLALTGASRNATIRGDHTHVPVGLVTVSEVMAAPATVLPFSKSLCIMHGHKYFFFLLDINECTTGSNRCSQNCHNAVGSYACSCYSGYRLNSDRISCRGKAMNYSFFVKASVFMPIILIFLYRH